MKLTDEFHFFFWLQRKRFKALLSRLWCLISPNHYHFNVKCICTQTGTLRVNSVYCYREGSYLDKAKLLNVHLEKEYLYFQLYLINKALTVTVCHINKPDAYSMWKLSDENEYEEIISRRLWHEVDNQNDLLEFEFE
jgi:hypothetical protein